MTCPHPDPKANRGEEIYNYDTFDMRHQSNFVLIEIVASRRSAILEW
jgi:hypothetical protein